MMKHVNHRIITGCLSLLLLLTLLLPLTGCKGKETYNVYYWTNHIASRGQKQDMHVVLNSTGVGISSGTIKLRTKSGWHDIPFEYEIIKTNKTKKLQARYTSQEAPLEQGDKLKHPDAVKRTWSVSFKGYFLDPKSGTPHYNSLKASGISLKRPVIVCDSIGATRIETNRHGKTVSRHPYYYESTYSAEVVLGRQ